MNGEIRRQVTEFQIRRSITSLFKMMLETLEDVGAEHDEAFKNLESNVDPSFVPVIRQARFFLPEKRERLRKRILDAGNSCIRNITEEE